VDCTGPFNASHPAPFQCNITLPPVPSPLMNCTFDVPSGTVLESLALGSQADPRPHFRSGSALDPLRLTAPINRSAIAGSESTLAAGSTSELFHAVGLTNHPPAGSFLDQLSNEPWISFHRANASRRSLAGMLAAPEEDTSLGSLVLSTRNQLASEAVLAPMTWTQGGNSFDLALTMTGSPAMGSPNYLTTLPVNLCCTTGRGRVPADAARRNRGLQRIIVTVNVADVTSDYTLTQPLGSESFSFMDLVLSDLSLRLGNVTGSRHLLHWPSLRSDVPESHMNLTDSLDVPGAGVVLVTPPGYASSVRSVPPPMGGSVTSGEFMNFDGVIFEVELRGYGFPVAGDATASCNSNAGSPDVVDPPVVHNGRPMFASVTARLTQLEWSSGTVTGQQALALSDAILDAAGQPATWWERRGCVASDRRSV
jgi:hypothetical protein